MTEWGVVVVIGALVTLFFTVGKPVIKLNTTITRLIDKMDTLAVEFTEQKKSTREFKSKMYDVTNNHEKRISRLEAEKEQKDEL